MALLDETYSSSNATEKYLCDLLLNSTEPIAKRFRALFSLRNLTGPAPRRALILASRDASNLLAHEAVFALGQMQDEEAIPALEDILNDLSCHPIVRHEAAEALGAIALKSSIEVLKNSLVSDPAQEVRETCELALSRIDHFNNSNEVSPLDARSPYNSVDPAAPAPVKVPINHLRDTLLDEHKRMYDRYAALFSLRNCGGSEAISAIIASLGSKSALLKHEVAYVLGQMQDRTATEMLSKILKDGNEHPMVRHEAAEALGSIADEDSVALLESYVEDPEPIVAQSCEVALSMLHFEQSGKAFEFFFQKDALE